MRVSGSFLVALLLLTSACGDDRSRLISGAANSVGSRSALEALKGTQKAISGVVEAADFDLLATPSEFSATWTVPPAPTSPDATVFLFSSLEPDGVSASFQRIIQPVLQYGKSDAGGGAYWTISSWYCTTDVGCPHSNLITVNAGDQITGTIQATKCDNNGGCSYQITTTDTTLGQSTTLQIQETIPYPHVQGGVLEVYNVERCDQLPASSGETFGSFQLTDQAGQNIVPSWRAISQTVDVDCNYSVRSKTGSATLSWQS